MTIDAFLVGSDLLRVPYGHVPVIREVRVRSVNLNWRGPTLTLRVDLASFPDAEVAPQEWVDAGMDTVQCQLEFLAVEDLALARWSPPVVAVVEAVPWGERRRMRVRVGGEGLDLEFSSSDSVVVRHVSAFKGREDGADGGRHLFVSRVDARRHTSLPGTDEKTYFA
ncbi:Imm50 family immunity protein [Streptomyces sp. NPDC005485]|uniref:Imm50 family immunity protein n=1 Tax=Streptomyces sp. NPDC005485 TaxID=3155591 RepID=UPI00339FE64C